MGDVGAGTTRSDEDRPSGGPAPGLRRFWGHLLVVCYFAGLTALSQWQVVVGGRNGSQSVFVAALSARGPTPADPVLDQAAGYLKQALGRLGVEMLLRGHGPWWNPFTGLGAPLVGDFQSAVFAPVSLLVYGLHLGRSGVDAAALVDTFVAGVSAYVLARLLRLGRPAALVAGTAFALAGSFVWFGTLFGDVVAWTPLVVALSVRLLRPGRIDPRAVVALGVVVAVQVLGGFPEAIPLECVLLVLPVGVAFTLRSGPGWFLRDLAVVGGFVAGLAMSAFAWVPFVSVLPAETLWNGPGAALVHLPAWSDLALVVPFAFGRWFAPPLSVVDWYQLGGYVGVVSAWCALYGLFGTRRAEWRIVSALVAAIVVGLGWANGLPPFSVLGRLPGVDRIPLGRLAIPEVELAVAVLAGIGVDRARGWRPALGATGLVAAALVATVALSPALPDRSDLVAGVAWLVFCGTLVPLAGRWAKRVTHDVGRGPGRQVRRAGTAGMALVLVAGELLALSNLDWRELPAGGHPWRTPAWVALARRELGRGPLAGGRLYSADGLLQPGYSGDFGLRDLSFEDAVVPTRTVDFVERDVDPPNPNPLAFIGVPLTGTLPSHLVGLELAGVSLVAVPEPGCGGGCRGLARVARDPAAGVGLFRLPDPQPFLWFPARLEVGTAVPSAPFTTAEVPTRLAGVAAGSAVARVVRRSDDRLVVALHCADRRLLVVRQVDFPGWRATIDGRDVPIEPVDGVFQGLVVPAGRSRLVLRYRPPGLRPAELVSLLAAVVALAVVGAPALRGRLARPVRRGGVGG